jgi:hypothetical protein
MQCAEVEREVVVADLVAGMFVKLDTELAQDRKQKIQGRSDSLEKWWVTM